MPSSAIPSDEGDAIGPADRGGCWSRKHPRMVRGEPVPTWDTMKTTHHERERGGLSLEEIAKRLGRTRERIRQIESMALAKLRKAFHRAGYSDQEMLEALRDLAAERDRREK